MMPLGRRRLFWTASALAGAALPAAGQGSWPERPIRLVVPFAAGTSTDILGRLIAQHLSRGLDSHAVVVDNRAGAGGTIGAAAVAQAAPDGHTLLVGTIGTHAVNPHLMRGLPYDPRRDFTPILAHSKTKILLVVPPALQVRTLQEFLALGRQRVLNIGSAGTGTTGHLNQALLAHLSGVTMNHIPYRDGAQAVTDLLAGRIDGMFYHTQFVRPHLEQGSMVALGITGAERSRLLPGVPTFAEAGYPDISAEGWWALFGPSRLPPAIVLRINRILNEALREPATLSSLDASGIEPIGGTPEELAAFLSAELERWGEVIRRADIRVDS
ncbi:MAG: tripartite tricarboxylate transporter substrate-binding protein [Rhodovarius sp.]|nr:tripartite tricarboxylate transporter substrate-binding protein [Rhodovarius sp.]